MENITSLVALTSYNVMLVVRMRCLCQTSEADLRSCLGMRLKRQMLLTLVRRSMCPDDPSKAAEIAKKYQQFVIPVSKTFYDCSGLIIFYSVSFAGHFNLVLHML